MGGEVYKKPNDACFRVYHKDSGSYGLAMSRSLGDFQSKKVGVSGLPDIKEIDLSDGDIFLSLVSDGSSEYLDDDRICQVIYDFAQDPKKGVAKPRSHSLEGLKTDLVTSHKSDIHKDMLDMTEEEYQKHLRTEKGKQLQRSQDWIVT